MNPEYIHLSFSCTTSKVEYNSDPIRWEHFATRELTQHAAHFLAEQHAETIRHEERVERRMDLYVATPDIFWKHVEDEAKKIAMRFMASGAI